MATTDPIADPSHLRLSPSDFLAAVKHHAIIPDLPTDVADLQQRLCRCLLGPLDLAEQFARGSLKGKRLAQLFPQLEQNVRACSPRSRTSNADCTRRESKSPDFRLASGPIRPGPAPCSHWRPWLTGSWPT